MFKKLFTSAWVALLFTYFQLAAAATNVSVTATPSNPTAPATVTLAASGDSDGNPIMVTKVEYFNGTTSLGVSVQSPFTLTLSNLAAGTYQISVKVTTTDPVNPVLQSAPIAVTVGTAQGAATAYFIHTDQLNTPRAITDSSGKLVWQWDSDPFGKDAANEQPTGQPAFTFNQRFPGQQFDRESNLHYNYFRDYDPTLGRYIQSDPIGLNGGINTFGYVGGDPVSFFDPEGLEQISVFGTSPHPPYTEPDNPIFQQRVSEYADSAGTFFIYGHGYPGGIWDGVNNRYITTPDQLAGLLKKNGWKPGQPVVIYACRTGMNQDGGKPGIAEQFAKKYKTPTRAPTRQVWYNQNRSANGPSWIYGKNKDGSMNTNDPGEMKDF